MKNAPIILSSLALVGVLVLFGLHFSQPKSNNTTKHAPTGVPASGGLRIAHVNIDSFEANYSYLKTKREEFNKRTAAMESELQRSAQQMQSKAEEFQRKVQSGMSEAEGLAEQKKLVQMQQSLANRKESMENQLLKEQDDFNTDLHKRLDDFLEEYNKDKNYDYILSYSRSSPFIYVNKDLDITDDVIKGMNERAGSMPGNADTSKKK